MTLALELLNIGLSQKEAEVYVAALQLGYASVQDIADKSGINRTSAYSYIKNLITRGLMNATERFGRVYYIAEKPEKLKYIYEQQEREIKRKREILNYLMPELDSIYNLAKQRPSVRYYRHADELQSIRQEIANLRADEILNIFNYEQFKDFTDKNYIQTLLSTAHSFKAIYIAREKHIDPKIMPFLQNENFHLRYLPVDKFGFLTEITIANDNVYIAREEDCLLIRDPLFSQTLGLLFQTLWQIAEKI
jgi:sugar-specific transcriptional regulator TrmB